MEDLIMNACHEWPIDERNIQYSEVVGGMETLPVSMYLNDWELQDQQKEGWTYGCVFYSDSHGSNIMNFIEGSTIRSKWSEMCNYAVENGYLDPKAGASIISWPKVGTKMGYLDGYAIVSTLEEIKHSIAHKRPVQVGSNKIDWFSANQDNGWTVSAGASYGHSIILDWYDDIKQQLRIKQSYNKWDNWHQYLNYSDLWLLYPTRFSLIDKEDPIISLYKKQIMENITIDSAKQAFEAGIWNWLNPKNPASREEVAAMIFRAINK